MNDPGFIDHCLELLSPLGATRARRMFGGHGVYVDDLFFALVIRDVLYLKVDDAHREAFERAGCAPFTYMAKDDVVHSMSYYAAPEDAMESPAEMLPWARRALAAAVAARARAPKTKKMAAPKATAGKATAKKAPTRKRPGTSTSKPAATSPAAPVRKPRPRTT